MKVDFQGDGLHQLYTDPAYDAGYPRGVVKAFRKRVWSLHAAASEQDVRRVKGNHLEKLAGRKGEYSIRLNRQWRLILRFSTCDGDRTAVLLGIEDYH